MEADLYGLAIKIMEDKKLVTLFMLVTDRDCIIADYAIKSYHKIYVRKTEFGFQDFVLYVYLNCLSEENKNKYAKKWEAFPYTLMYDNAAKVESTDRPYPGQKIVSPEGIERSRDDFAESYDELWTDELKKFNTPFVATADADFEILDADFYFYLLQQLKENPGHIAASSSYDVTTYLYDTYSKRNIILSERNHTWFCIYRKEAFKLSQISHYYYETVTSEGKVLAYDSAAYFQHDLRTKHQCTFAVPPKAFESSFVHYGAGSKNKSLNSRNIRFYRKVFLLSTIGLFYGRGNLAKIFINTLTRKIAGKLFSRYLNRFTKERSVYVYDEANS